MDANELRNKINSAEDLKIEPVAAQEWELEEGLFIRTMSSDNRDAWETEQWGKATANKKLKFGGKRQNKNDEVEFDMSGQMLGVKARFLVRVLCDENGVLLYKDTEAEELGKKSSKVVNRIYDQAAMLNGISEEDLEEIAKN